jgi:alkanesulfonate monooxygenase SsuD/methylene tetrahydromethanopterin reductase-like flavin-dependent oxidoreductase (luciferase family)
MARSLDHLGAAEATALSGLSGELAADAVFPLSVALQVRLGTAAAPIYHRWPVSMARTAATVDGLSGGRFRLGLGTGHRITKAQWHGEQIGRPLAEMPMCSRSWTTQVIVLAPAAWRTLPTPSGAW